MLLDVLVDVALLDAVELLDELELLLDELVDIDPPPQPATVKALSALSA